MIDSYLLSESSMFVSQRRMILKTCGTTTPLDCLERLLQLVVKYTGFDHLQDIFYSRKNFMRPDLQKAPHQMFEQEVKSLDKHFNDGAGYCLGHMNSDCWYLYTLNRMISEKVTTAMPECDQTIEILMANLDPKIMEIFSKRNSMDGKDCSKKSGIDCLLPEMDLDDYLFEPCGYSMNGVLKDDSLDSGSGDYVTIHITPEPQFSYVSFETNVAKTSYLELIQRVLKTFMPGKFLLTIFTTRSSVAASSHQELKKWTTLGKWRRNAIQYCSFEMCDLTYAHFVKFPS